MKITRRDGLKMGLGLAMAGGLARPASAVEPAQSLNAIAARTGRRFGSAVGMRTLADPRYRELLTRECGVLVPENELKWGWVRRRPDAFDFAAFDQLLAFAEANRLKMRGHTLLWHHPRWFPPWVATWDFGSRPAEAAARMITEHVGTVCRRYGARIHSYDVVNEAVDNVTGEMRETVFSRAMGSAEAVLDLAFHTAREAAPGAQLIYNDYMNWEPGKAAFRGGVLRALEGFRRRGTPVDALGVQSHIGSGNNAGDAPDFGSRDEAEWRRFLDDVVAMGYDLLITEFDVNDRGVPGTIPERDRAVADFARAYLDIVLAYPRFGDILAWGLCDSYSWLQQRGTREDGQPKRPCPYDSDFQPKPLRAAIAAAFANASAQHPAA